MISLLPRVWDLRNSCTAYDAVYVALAEVLDAPLLTRDKRFFISVSPLRSPAIVARICSTLLI